MDAEESCSVAAADDLLVLRLVAIQSWVSVYSQDASA